MEHQNLWISYVRHNYPLTLIDTDIVFADVQAKIIPGVTHWQSPNFFAYYPSNSSIAGFLGEMLSAGINMVGFSWITSPAATELEMIVLDWLAKMLNLPDDFLSTGKDFINFLNLVLLD